MLDKQYMIESIFGSYFANILVFGSYILAAFLTLFLFFRAGKHEFVDEEILFDLSLISLFGALLFGRVVDFIVRYKFYEWSFKKLFFFNAYFGFDWYGALLGALIFSVIYLRKKKQKILFIFDLASAEIVFGAMVVSLFNYLVFGMLISILYFIFLFIIFWTLKRLSKVKRFDGFFASLALILTGFLNIIFLAANEQNFQLSKTVDYEFMTPFAAVILGFVLFYKFSKRNFYADLKNLGAFFLLSLFKLKRITFSKSEANLAARSMLLSPYHLVKLVIDLVKLLGREIYMSINDFIHVLGVNK